MLDKETRRAIASGYLKIYPVRYFWEAFEIATGVAFGAKSVHEKKFQTGTALDIISKKLARISNKKLIESHDKKQSDFVKQPLQIAASTQETDSKNVRSKKTTSRS
jgi:hypothetical protein